MLIVAILAAHTLSRINLLLRTIVIGDTRYDALSKAGLRIIGLLCGGWPAEELKNAGCIEIYKDPADLLKAYDQSALKRD